MTLAEAKRDVTGHIENLAEHAAELLMDLIRFPSVCGQEMGAIRYMKQALDTAGLQPTLFPMDPAIKRHAEYTSYADEPPWEGRANLVTDYGGASDGLSLILNGHLDVVPAGSWADAFEPKRDGDAIVGRGAADAKAGAVAGYLAVTALAQCRVPLSGRLSLQHVIDEETGGNGTLTLLTKGCEADAAIVAECTGNRICPANRGALWFHLRTTGHSTHMGRIDQGVSAIEKANQAIGILKEYEAYLIENFMDDLYFQGLEHRPIQLCVGMMRAGDWPSKVPDECDVEGGIGFLPNKDIDDVKKEMREWIRERGDDWLREHFELRFERLHNAAYAVPADHAIVRCMQDVARETGLPDSLEGWTVSCDARLFPRVARMPAITVGPGELVYAHGEQEQVRLSDVVQAAKLYALTAIEWCGVEGAAKERSP